MSLATDVSVRVAAETKFCFTRSIWAGVRFGTPGKNCAGSGICEVYAMGGQSKRSGCGCQQFGQIVARGWFHVEFRFFNQDLKPCTKKKYFHGEQFLVEEDYVLPPFVKQALGLRANTISAGLHTIKYDEHYTSVLIRLH